MLQMKSKSPRKYDPEFVLASYDEALARYAKYEATSTNDEEMENAKTLEYLDDEFAFSGRNSQPVWGIGRNPIQKRLIVTFRGTINQKDAEQDLKAAKRLICSALLDHIPSPNAELLERVKDHAGKVHLGFYQYLVDTKDENGISKFEKIITEIFSRLKDPKYEGYSLVITGHSLGAAMATITAIACSISTIVTKPVKLITYGSPHVGNPNFARAFQELQKANALQHLRVTTDDDAVPQGLAIFGYVHTPSPHLNLHSMEGSIISQQIISKITGQEKKCFTLSSYDIEEDEATPSRVKELISNAKPTPMWVLGNPAHALQEYKRRLDQAKEDFELLNFDDLFNGKYQNCKTPACEDHDILKFLIPRNHNEEIE